MKRVYYTLLIVLIIFLGVMLGVKYYLNNKNIDLATTSVEKTPLTLVINKANLSVAFSTMLNYFDLSKSVPEFAGKDYNNQPFSLSDYQRRRVLLFFSARDCRKCALYYPKLKEWAQLYANSLKTVVCFSSMPTPEVADDLSSAGITVVPRAAELAYYFNATTHLHNFLIDENGVIQHFFHFSEMMIKEHDELIEHFAANGRISEGVLRRDYIKKDAVVPDLPVLAELNQGPDLVLEDLLGKPSIIFFGTPVCAPCESSYPLIRELQSTYQEKVNLLLIIEETYPPESYQTAKAYLEQVDPEIAKMFDTIPDPSKDLEKLQQNGITIPVYRGYNTTLFRWGISRIPSIVVLDQENRVKSYYPASMGTISEDTDSVRTYILEDLKNLEK